MTSSSLVKTQQTWKIEYQIQWKTNLPNLRRIIFSLCCRGGSRFGLRLRLRFGLWSGSNFCHHTQNCHRTRSVMLMTNESSQKCLRVRNEKEMHVHISLTHQSNLQRQRVKISDAESVQCTLPLESCRLQIGG